MNFVIDLESIPSGVTGLLLAQIALDVEFEKIRMTNEIPHYQEGGEAKSNMERWLNALVQFSEELKKNEAQSSKNLDNRLLTVFAIGKGYDP